MRLIEVYFSANKRRWENALTLLQVPFNVNADQLVWNDNKKKVLGTGPPAFLSIFIPYFGGSVIDRNEDCKVVE
jgi:hypothetical protein